MPQNCGGASPFLVARRKKTAALTKFRMQDQQRLIAEWMRGVMERRQISARDWAARAKLGKDTVSRAVREDYANVTSTRTIAKLAEAVGEKPPGAAGGVPSAAVLAEILGVAFAATGAAPVRQEITTAMAQALRDTLLHLADDPEASNDPAQTRAIARTVIRRQPH